MFRNLTSHESSPADNPRRHINFSRALTILALTVGLTGCASNSGVVHHGFSYGPKGAHPEVQVLDYQYGAETGLPTRPSKLERERGMISQGSVVVGRMPVADFIYVKWRDLASRKILERTVDLRPLLPRQIENRYVHFGFENRQLSIYVIDINTLRRPGTPACPAVTFEQYQCSEIYPAKN